MLNGRKRFTTAIAGLALAASTVLSLGAPGPANADPDIDDVRERVDRLYHEAEQASERYNDVKLELDELDAELESLEADESRQGDRLEQVRTDVRDAIIQQSQGQSIGAAGEILSSDSGAVLNQLSTVSTVNQLQDALLSDYNDELKAFTIRREQTEERRDQVAELEQQLEEEKETIEDKHAEAEELLDELEAEEREAIVSRDDPGRVPSVSASGRAAAAVDFAMAQVGDAYVYGAAGPDAWDCSGLTMVAWAQAGVSLPHSSSAQYGSGTPVSASELQPGDLVFYYSPISHVGMYIGNGMIVHAANPSSGTRVDGLYSMPYVGAVRPG